MLERSGDGVEVTPSLKLITNNQRQATVFHFGDCSMKATVYYAPGDVRVETVPDPVIQHPTDAIVRITHACICGSDLWFYRGEEEWQPGWRTGHEWMGIVEAVGSLVRTLKKGYNEPRHYGQAFIYTTILRYQQCRGLKACPKCAEFFLG